MNWDAVDAALSKIEEVAIPDKVDGLEVPPIVPDDAPAFVKRTTAKLMSGQGECLKVSDVPDDGTWPRFRRHSTRSATSRSTSRCGILTPACSAGSASWYVRTPRSARRSIPRRSWARLPNHSRAPIPSPPRGWRGTPTRSRSRSRTAPAAPRAWRIARPRRRRRSRWSCSLICAIRSARTTPSSWGYPIPTRSSTTRTS